MKSVHERFQIVASYPALTDDAALSTSWINAGDVTRIFGLVLVGATDTTTDAKLQQATDSSGTGAKDVTDAAITQVTSTGDNRHCSIEVHPSKLDTANGFYWVRLTITAGNGSTGSNIAGVLMAEKRHQPVSQAAAYAEQIVVAY